MNISEIIDMSVGKWPDKTAIIDRHGEMYYGALLDEITSLSKKLVRYGVGPGQGVGLIAKNGREFIIAAFAVLRCGAVILPMHNHIKALELEEVLKTGIHAIIDDMSGIKPLDGPLLPLKIHGADTLRLTWSVAPKTSRFADFTEDPAFVRFTSGTTGKSKGVVLSHKGILERTALANRGLGLSSDDIVICVLPMAFHFLVSTVLYLEVGATLIIAPDHFAGTVLSLSSMYSATFLYSSPIHYRYLCADRSGASLKTVKRAISTSSTLPAVISRDFFKRYGLAVSQAYGIIEVGLPLVNIDRPLENPDSVGKALPGFEVAILDGKLSPMRAGEVGQLALRGPGMFSGYLTPRIPASEVLLDGWFISGDQAFMDADGYVTVVGRTKSIINVAGNKVFPDEVESVINRHLNVEVSRVCGRAHPQMGEVVHAYVVLKDPDLNTDIEGIRRFCQASLTSYKVPHSVAIVKEIGETLSGKIKRDTD